MFVQATLIHHNFSLRRNCLASHPDYPHMAPHVETLKLRNKINKSQHKVIQQLKQINLTHKLSETITDSTVKYNTQIGMIAIVPHTTQI